MVIHPLADTRRVLPIAACNELLAAHPDFALVVSYNPGPLARELKPSTRQRFCALEFGYLAPEMEAAIVAHEAGVPLDTAAGIVAFGVRTRRLQGHGLDEGASTRMLVQAAQLAAQGVAPRRACRMAVVDALSDEPGVHDALRAALPIWRAEHKRLERALSAGGADALRTLLRALESTRDSKQAKE